MDLLAIIWRSRPPDEDLTYLIEEAFLSYQIDSVRYTLALLWLDRNTVVIQ
ncbi:hypothetical protein [Lentisalinibacter orientalis]|uniref:hypothetical protein n=1 Tax=Lentisalinibacter orientalis TaxID=2992241 RepID=UPI00386F93C8